MSLRPKQFILLLAAACSAFAILALPSRACDDKACCCRQDAAFSVRQSGPWHVADSPSFQVCSLASDAEAVRVARYCECLRSQLAATWRTVDAPWSPRCQVVMHGSVSGYKHAVGPGGDSTLGSSLAAPGRGPIRSRRIDLRTDVDDILTAALPHELCHLVIADHFRDGPPPLWFDEGLALQYDPPAKRRLHEKDCQLALSQGMAFPLEELLAENAYPAQSRWGAFYGQSCSLVRWLLSKQPPERLIQFAKDARGLGIDRAVQQSYGLKSVDALFLAWRKDAGAHSSLLPTAFSLPSPSPFALVSD